MLTKRSTKTYNHYDELRGSGLKVASHFLCYRNVFSIIYVYYGSLVAVQTSHSKTLYWKGRVFPKECPLLCICSAISIGYCTIYFLEITDLKTKNIFEKNHLQFCKKILGVRTTTPNFMVYGELGRYPIELQIKIKNVVFLEQNCG